MWKRAIAASFLAALIGGPAGATTWAISPVPVDYQVNGWALHCDAATSVFNACEAVKRFGPATVKIRTHSFVILAEVDRQCRGRKVEGDELEWPLEDERIDLIIGKIQDETDVALQACDKPKLSEAARRDIHIMFLLVYGLRPGR